MGKIYESVGRCIYCGEQPDSDEHIIPIGLKGDLVLPDSSCAPCREITRDIETFVLRGMLGDIRQKWGIRSKRHKKEKLKPPRIGRRIEGGVSIEHVDLDDYPEVLIMPTFQAPGYLAGNAPRLDIPHGRFWMHAETSAAEKLKRHGKDAMAIQNYSPDKFCRFIAKMAHGYAAAEFGIESFSPWLTELIKGTDTRFSYLVGASPRKAHNPPPDSRIELGHALILEVYQFPGSNPFVAVHVFLFGTLGAPGYMAIVGEPHGELLKRFPDGASILES